VNFYVYENWTHDRTRIHRGDCTFCNEGQGRGTEDSGRNGRWHGPFSREQAFELAKALKRSRRLRHL
jgi:hypothetical protein